MCVYEILYILELTGNFHYLTYSDILLLTVEWRVMCFNRFCVMLVLYAGDFY